MMDELVFECTIDILGNPIRIKIYREGGSGYYSFTQSHYLQDETDLEGVYKPNHGAVDTTLEGLISKINRFKNRYSKITQIGPNPLF